MKKLSVILAILIFSMCLVPGAFANMSTAGKVTPSENVKVIGENHTNGSPEQVQVKNQIENLGEDRQIREREETALHRPEGVENLSKQRRKEIGDIIREIQEKEEMRIGKLTNQTGKARYNHGLVVRETASALLELANLTGDPQIELKVKKVAEQCNESAEKIMEAEERIQKRSRIMRLLFGGDDKAAQELEQEMNRIRVQLQALRQIMNQIEDEQLRLAFQEQIQEMEQELNKLQQMAEQEKKQKGLLGWLIKI